MGSEIGKGKKDGLFGQNSICLGVESDPLVLICHLGSLIDQPQQFAILAPGPVDGLAHAQVVVRVWIVREPCVDKNLGRRMLQEEQVPLPICFPGLDL